MRDQIGRSSRTQVASPTSEVSRVGRTPGKQSLVEQIYGSPVHNPLAPIQRRAVAISSGDSGPAEQRPVSLPSTVQHRLEAAMGADLSSVRMYEGNQADRQGASAYAQGEEIHFASGQFQPSTRAGLELIGHEFAHVVQQREGRVASPQGKDGVNPDPALEAEADAVGARVAAQVASGADIIPTGDEATGHAPADGPIQQYPARISTVKGQKAEVVEVANKLEEADARRIISKLENDYGIILDSPAGVQAIKQAYNQAPSKLRSNLRPAKWLYSELQALEQCMDNFAQILGNNRAASSLNGTPQDITTLSKVNYPIDQNTPTAAKSDDLGETFLASNNISFFKTGEDHSEPLYGNNPTTQFQGTSHHETGHGLIEPHHLNSFVAAFPYWANQNTASGIPGAEPPPPNGDINAAEDLAESIALYHKNAAWLLNNCPQRHAWIQNVMNNL